MGGWGHPDRESYSGARRGLSVCSVQDPAPAISRLQPTYEFPFPLAEPKAPCGSAHTGQRP